MINVFSDGTELQELGLENKTLISGWRQEGTNLWITLESDQNATVIMENVTEIKFNSEDCGDLIEEDCILRSKPRYFNNHSWALTISGHHTIDLFKWSMKFDESPLVFTWLVEPQEVEDFSWILVIIAAGAGIGAVTYTRHLILRDQKEQSLSESE